MPIFKIIIHQKIAAYEKKIKNSKYSKTITILKYRKSNVTMQTTLLGSEEVLKINNQTNQLQTNQII